MSIRIRLFVLFFLSCAFSFAQDTKNFSGLKNIQLRPCPGSNHDVFKKINRDLKGEGLPAWPGANGPASGSAPEVDPSIDQLTLTEDREMEFRAEITYSGLSAGAIKVIIVDIQGNKIEGIKEQLIQVDGSSGLLDLNVKLSPDNYEANTIINTGYIKLQFQPSGSGVGKEFCFVFPKKWKILQRNETITVSVVATPFKTAGQLTVSNALLPIPGVKYVENNPKTTSAPATKDTASRKSSAIKPVVKDSVENDPKGASNRAVSLFDLIRSDVSFNNPADISPISLSNIYYDRNPKSGMFYYLPASYNLNWSEKGGFNFNSVYTKSTSEGNGNVNMTASLLTGISSNEQSFIKEFLSSYLKGIPEIKFNDVTALIPTNPKISLQGNLQSLYNIGPDKISVSVTSSIYDPIAASWSAETDVANEILTALGKGVGITGEMSFKADASDVSGFSVPVKIGLANEYSFGKMNLQNTSYRSEVLSNKFPFPIQLTNIHVLIFNEAAGKFVPCVYTWSLGDKQVLPHSKIKIDANAIPTWIDNDPRVKKIWVEYRLLPCEYCTEEVISQVSSGSSGDRVHSIKMNSMGIFKKYNFSFMRVTIRSRFLDPKGNLPRELTFNITKDNEDVEAGPFYLWNEKDLSYEYKIELFSEDKTYSGTAWIAARDYQLYINRDIVKKSLGENLPSSK